MYYHLFIILCCYLGGCASPAKSIVVSAKESLPCWFYQPINLAKTGIVGISKLDVIGSDSAQSLARSRALSGLDLYLNLNLKENKIKSLSRADKTHFNLQGHSLDFSQQTISSGYFYQYLLFDSVTQPNKKETVNQCEDNKRIELAACLPKWVCHFSEVNNMAGFIGVSAPAASGLFSHQYKYAVKNALTMIEYLYGVNISSNEQFLRYKGGATTLRLRLRENKVDLNGSGLPKEIRLIVREMGFQGQQLYVWVTSPDLPLLIGNKDLSWLQKPDQQGYHGAVGIAGRGASGLLSEQVRRAINDGATALAKNKELKIKVSTSIKNGTFMEKTQQSVKAKLDVQVIGLHMKENKVYVWVVEKP
jgi:hypothetical protein